jgi:hypothetical protein
MALSPIQKRLSCSLRMTHQAMSCTRLLGRYALVPSQSACVHYLSHIFRHCAKRQVQRGAFVDIRTSSDHSLCKPSHIAIPDITFSSQHPSSQQSVRSYWSQIASEANLGCVVRLIDVHELAQDIKLWTTAWQSSSDDDGNALRFAIRSSGHSPVKDFDTFKGFVLIDLRRFKDVRISDDIKTAFIGTGAQWRDLSTCTGPRRLRSRSRKNGQRWSRRPCSWRCFL